MARTSGASMKGTVFRITPAGALTTLHTFVGSDGSSPNAGLVQGSDGNFYGATANGGTSDYGTVYRITPAGALTTLYRFSGGSDGGLPESVLVQGSDGNFYGTTQQGGTNFNGTVYRITPAGALTTLYRFNSTDGRFPQAGLVQGSDGNFYGTTQNGGTSDYGTVFKITPAGVLTTLHLFNSSDGNDPTGVLVQGSDGNFYGTTSSGGANGKGTVFRLTLTSVAPPAGSLQLTASTVTVAEGAGAVTLSINRANGSAGAVSVNYATGDGTAVAGVDYQPVSGTLSWADGDTDPKTISVPIIDRGLTSGSTQFFVNLASPGGGATLGAPAQAAVTIFETDLPPVENIQSVSLLSPPTGITISQNRPVSLYAEVEALANTLASVEIFAIDNNTGDAMDLGGFTSQRGQKTWQPAVAGDFTLQVVATDTLGQTKQATNPIHVAPAASVGAAPQANLYGLLDGRTVALGDTVPVVAQAVDGDGNPLQDAQFYLDGVPIDSTPIANRATRGVHSKMTAGRRTNADSNLAGLFLANPTLGAIQQLLTVIGTNADGLSVVSRAATLFGKADAGAPPTVAISNVADGDTLPADTAGQVVSVAAQSGSQPIAQVELVVDNQSAGVATSAPYNFNLPALPAGPHALTAIATAQGNLSKVSAPVIVRAEQVSAPGHPAFFGGEVALGGGAYFLQFPGGNPFGYYSYLPDANYIFHFDLGYEYLFDANDGKSGVYFYDFTSGSFFYTSPAFPFPYLYDFTLNTVLYYFPDPTDPQHYNTDGIRYFSRLDTGEIFSK